MPRPLSPMSPSAIIAAAAAQGEWAIDVLKDEEKAASENAVTARARLEQLAVEALSLAKRRLEGRTEARDQRAGISAARKAPIRPSI